MNFDWLDADDIGKSQRLFWQIMTGVKSQLTRRLTVTASVGAAFANAYQTARCRSSPTSTFIQTGAASSMVALGSLNYLLLKNTSVTLSAAHLIVPTTLRPAAENDDGRVYARPQHQLLVERRGVGEFRAHRIKYLFHDRPC